MEWMEQFTSGLRDLGSFDQLLQKFRDGIIHPCALSLCASLCNSWQKLSCGGPLIDDDVNIAIQWAQVALDFSWEQLNTGNWKDVDVMWRKVYSVAALLKAMGLVQMGQFQGALLELDRGILMGEPIFENALHTFATVLTAEVQSEESGSKFRKESEDVTMTQDEPHLAKSDKLVHRHKVVFKNYKPFLDVASGVTKSSESKVTVDEEYRVKRPKSEQWTGKSAALSPDSSANLRSHSSVPFIDPSRKVQIVHCPSLESFYQQYMLTASPVIITGGMDHWPAYSARKWSLEYLKQIAGPRTVPVELGSRYTDEDWSQKLMTIAEFIDSYIIGQDGSTPQGYLAQHQLFDQIPELRRDICIPDYCYLRTAEESCEAGGEDPVVRINAWFGPRSTVSPLHHDPEHNLLTQVVGWKYIKLYSEDQTEYLYPHEGLLTNTSQVDVDNPNLQKHPLFSKATCRECVLHPGQMLYIPPRCWHYVRSLDVSFSVSFWWN